MTEQDKQFIRGILQHLQGGCSPKDLPKFIGIKELLNLLGIIDELDKQLTEIKEAGEPFVSVAKIIADVTRQELWISIQEPTPDLPLTITIGRARRDPYDVPCAMIMEKHFVRLAEALKGVKDE